MDLNNHTTLITGASSGIGAATARALRKRWPQMKLLLAARRMDRIEALAQDLGNAQAFEIDVRKREAVENFAKNIAPDILVNNAGLAAGLDTFQEANIDDWEQMIDTNIKGLLYITRALLPKMITSGQGHVVNIGSIAGQEVYPKGHVYNATKFAVRALNEAMRIDTVGKNIRVTSINPGMVETEFSLVRFKGDSQKADTVYKGIQPLSPEDIAECIVWSLDRPQHVNIQEMLVMPKNQASVRDVYREV